MSGFGTVFFLHASLLLTRSKTPETVGAGEVKLNKFETTTFSFTLWSAFEFAIEADNLAKFDLINHCNNFTYQRGYNTFYKTY